MNHKYENIPEVLLELWVCKHDTPEYDSKFWAWEAQNELVINNPNQAWVNILKVLELTESELMIEYLGAGFLEDLLCQHDQIAMSLIRVELPNNKKLAQCMSSVWLRVSDTKLYREFYSLINMEPPFGDQP